MDSPPKAGNDNPETVEKRLKKWKRDWKIELIEKLNPEWKDLSTETVL